MGQSITLRNLTSLRLPVPSIGGSLVLLPREDRTFTGINSTRLANSRAIERMVNAGVMSIIAIQNDPTSPDAQQVEFRGGAGVAGTIRQYERNNVIFGEKVAVGSTPSNTTTYNINATAGEAIVNGIRYIAAALTDTNYNAAGGVSVTLAGATPGVAVTADGKSQRVRIVLLNTTGVTVALRAVFGAEATTGSEVVPTDAQVTAALSNALWVAVCNITVDRAGGVIAETFDNTVKPILSA